jgi:hypothetical protein
MRTDAHVHTERPDHIGRKTHDIRFSRRAGRRNQADCLTRDETMGFDHPGG